MSERVRFFPRQLLTANDFETEQKYHLEMRRLHNRLLHGVGIVEGLQVSADDSQSGALVLSPGFALDGFGREIIVDRPAQLDAGTCGKETCFVTIGYTETATAPVPTSDGGCEFSRVTESFLVAMATEDPGQGGSSQMLSVARLIRQDGRWTVDESYRPIVCRPRP